MIYVRFAPGISVEDAAAKLTAMGKALSKELPEGTRRDGRSRTSACRRTRAALLVSPNVAPNTGYLRVAFSRPRGAQALAGGDRRRGRARSSRASSPASRSSSTRAGSSRASSRTGTRRRSSSRCTTTTSRELDERGQGGRRGRADRSAASATCSVSLQIDYPEIHVDTDREKAGLVGVTAREAAADDARRDARQHQHAGRLDRLAQRPVVLRRHVLRRRAGRRHATRSAQLPVRVSATGKPVLARRLRRTCAAASGRSPSSATTSARVAHVLMQTEGRDIGHRGRRARGGAQARPAHARRRLSTSSGQVELMRTTFSGPRARARASP